MTNKKMPMQTQDNNTENKAPTKTVKKTSKKAVKRTGSATCSVVKKCQEVCNNCSDLGYVKQRFEIVLDPGLAKELKHSFNRQRNNGESQERYITRILGEALNG